MSLFSDIHLNINNPKSELQIGSWNSWFLVCDKCGGYYELQRGESPEDSELSVQSRIEYKK